MPSGGKRPGAGRKAGTTNRPRTEGATLFDCPLAYLLAVAEGRETPDALRIAAAKSCLPYVAPKARAPVESPPPRKLRQQGARGTEAAAQKAWREKAATIRRKHEGANG